MSRYIKTSSPGNGFSRRAGGLTGDFCTSRTERLENRKNPENAKQAGGVARDDDRDLLRATLRHTRHLYLRFDNNGRVREAPAFESDANSQMSRERVV